MKTAGGIQKKAFVLEEQLRVRDIELNALLEVTQAINNNISATGLMKLYENILVKQIGVKKLAVFTKTDRWVCTNTYGITPADAEKLIPEFIPGFKQISKLEVGSHSLADHFEVVIPVYHKTIPLAVTFLGGLLPDRQFTLDEKLTYIQTISSVIAVAIENKRLHRAQTNQKLLKSELELAGQMQTMLIPGNLPDDERISIGGVYLPHQEVGGDYYDYIELNENECMFCIGDISGKGIAAALLMANFQASVRSYSGQQISLAALIQNLNSRVNEITKGEKFITLFLAKFNFEKRELQYVNAGHNPAILYHNGKVKQLEEGCTILGMFEKLPYINVQSFTLKEEFIVFCYTDGLTDIENDKRQTLDFAEMINLIGKNLNDTPSEINKKVVDYLIDFKGSRLIDDDISLLTTKVYR